MRPYVVERDGNRMEFVLDIPAIVEAENADPSYSFLAELDSLAERPRIATLDRICRFLGSDLASMVGAGLSVPDITEVLEGCLANAGFRSGRTVG